MHDIALSIVKDKQPYHCDIEEWSCERLVQLYGDQLVFVRYRDDNTRQKRIKTVELIVDEQEWIPGVIIPVDRSVALRIDLNEADLRQQLKNAAAYWNPAQKAWIRSYRKALQIGLEKRIIDELADL